MKFQESYAIIKKRFEELDMSKVDKDFSGILCITGKDCGFVYASYISGEKFIEPKEHKSANIIVTVSDTTFEDILMKRVDIFKAFTTGQIKAKGNVFLAMSIYRQLK